MPRIRAIAESLPTHAAENPRHPASKLYTSKDGGSVRLTWSPVNKTWFLLWPGDAPVERQQVLSRFERWEEGDQEAKRITSGAAENPRGKKLNKLTWSEWARETKIIAERAGIRFGDLYGVGGDYDSELWANYFRQGLTPEEAVKQAAKPYETEGGAENPLERGRGTYTPHLRLHHYTGSLRITDLENAGKRGKKVKQLSVMPKTLNDDQASEIISRVADVIVQQDLTYPQVVDYLEAAGKDEYRLEETTLRGIDVEPPGVTIHLEKKFPDGTIVTIKSSGHDFHVTHSAVIRAPGKAADGYRQDTLYWPRAKADGILFYAWLRENVAKAAEMTLPQLEKVWDKLGARVESH